jgi:predicted nucleic acid-binding protein
LKTGKLVADSTFYFCFLEDIREIKQLFQLLDLFTFVMPPLVFQEVSRSEMYRSLKDLPSTEIQEMNFDTAQILRPFFSKKQLAKGETQVIVLAYHFFLSKNLFKIIIDEHQAREFVRRNFRELVPFLIGTIGFVGSCCYDYGYFTKLETIALLDRIEKSPFRSSSNLLTMVKNRVEAVKTP